MYVVSENIDFVLLKELVCFTTKISVWKKTVQRVQHRIMKPAINKNNHNYAMEVDFYIEIKSSKAYDFWEIKRT